MSSNMVIFTDLDGTFLDASNYDFEPLRPLVQTLIKHRIPVVFCTSKTCAEVMQIRRDLAIRDPFIVENGGAIYAENDYFPFLLDKAVIRHGFLIVELGIAYPNLTAALDQVEMVTSCKIHRFGRLSIEELCRVTGLPPARAKLAQQREYDEPFWFVDDNPAKRKAFIKKLRGLPGLRITQGNRFYHLKGTADKGHAVEILKRAYWRLWPSARFIGLGDSQNDLPMLRAVDVPILIRGARGDFNRDVVSTLPHVLRSPVSAPNGWAAALLAVIPQLSGAGEASLNYSSQ